jgi:hypothetical protein
MPKFFKTRKANMSTLQKQNLYQQYKYAVQNGLRPGPLASYREFISIPNFDVMVDMKCLDCHASLRVNFAIYADFMEREDAPFPVDQCPECGKLQFVPLDVYTKLID